MDEVALVKELLVYPLLVGLGVVVITAPAALYLALRMGWGKDHERRRT